MYFRGRKALLSPSLLYRKFPFLPSLLQLFPLPSPYFSFLFWWWKRTYPFHGLLDFDERSQLSYFTAWDPSWVFLKIKKKKRDEFYLRFVFFVDWLLMGHSISAVIFFFFFPEERWKLETFLFFSLSMVSISAVWCGNIFCSEMCLYALSKTAKGGSIFYISIPESDFCRNCGKMLSSQNTKTGESVKNNREIIPPPTLGNVCFLCEKHALCENKLTIEEENIFFLIGGEFRN